MNKAVDIIPYDESAYALNRRDRKLLCAVSGSPYLLNKHVLFRQWPSLSLLIGYMYIRRKFTIP